MSATLEPSTRAVTRDTRVEMLLEAWRLPFELETFELDQVRVLDATQARGADHRAPADQVDTYAMHMRHGADFPPIMVTPAGELVDGNTRVAALKRLGVTVFPAYVVTFGTLAQARLVAAAVNQMNGRRLTSEEVVAAAEGYLTAGYAEEAIARELGVSVSHVRNVRRERDYRTKAERTGLSDVTLTKPAQRSLALIAHDEPFRAAAELVATAKPAAKDVTKLVEAVAEATSDSEAVATVHRFRDEWAPSGPPPQPRTTSAKATRAAKAAGALAALVDDTEDLNVLVPADAGKRAAYLQAWQTAESAAVRVVAAFQSAP